MTSLIYLPIQIDSSWNFELNLFWELGHSPIFMISPYLCHFNLDIYKAPNLSTLGPN